MNNNIYGNSSDGSNRRSDLDERTVAHLPDGRIIQGNSSYYGASFNYINSIVGAGIIGIPLAIQQCGLMFGITMMLLVAYLVNRSVLMLISCGIITQKYDLEEICGHLLGRCGYYAALTFMFLNAYGGQIAYLVIVADTVPLAAQNLFPGSFLTDRHSALLFFSTMVILPLCLLRDLSSLSWTSLLSIVAVAVLVCIVLIAAPAASREQSEHFQSEDVSVVNRDLFAGIGTMSFAFVCQHNSFMVFRSLRTPTVQQWRWVAHTSVGFSLLLSLAFGLIGFFAFFPLVQGDLLNNFPVSYDSIAAARLLLAVTMLFTYPMELYVSRHCLARIISNARCCSSSGNGSVLLAEVGDASSNTTFPINNSSSGSDTGGSEDSNKQSAVERAWNYLIGTVRTTTAVFSSRIRSDRSNRYNSSCNQRRFSASSHASQAGVLPGTPTTTAAGGGGGSHYRIAGDDTMNILHTFHSPAFLESQRIATAATTGTTATTATTAKLAATNSNSCGTSASIASSNAIATATNVSFGGGRVDVIDDTHDDDDGSYQQHNSNNKNNSSNRIKHSYNNNNISIGDNMNEQSQENDDAESVVSISLWATDDDESRHNSNKSRTAAVAHVFGRGSIRNSNSSIGSIGNVVSPKRSLYKGLHSSDEYDRDSQQQQQQQQQQELQHQQQHQHQQPVMTRESSFNSSSHNTDPSSSLSFVSTVTQSPRKMVSGPELQAESKNCNQVAIELGIIKSNSSGNSNSNDSYKFHAIQSRAEPDMGSHDPYMKNSVNCNNAQPSTEAAVATDPVVEISLFLHVTLTLLLWGSSLGIALVAEELNVVTGLSGALASSTLGYILPPAVYLKTHERRLLLALRTAGFISPSTDTYVSTISMTASTAATTATTATAATTSTAAAAAIPGIATEGQLQQLSKWQIVMIFYDFYLPVLMLLFGVMSIIIGITTVLIEATR